MMMMIMIDDDDDNDYDDTNILGNFVEITNSTCEKLLSRKFRLGKLEKCSTA